MAETIADKFRIMSGSYSITLSIGNKNPTYCPNGIITDNYKLFSASHYYEDLYLIPKSVIQPVRTIINENKNGLNDSSIVNYERTAFAKMVLSEKPENMSIKDFLLPLANVGYGKPLIMSYILTFKIDMDLKAYKAYSFEEALKLGKSTFTDIVLNWPDMHELLKALFGLEQDEKTGNTSLKFLSNVMVNNLGMNFNVFLDSNFCSSRKKILEAFKFEEAFEDNSEIIVPVYIDNVTFVKAIKTNCPPYTPENKFESVYASPGKCMDSKAIPETFRRAMDYLNYFGRLEIVHKRHTDDKGQESTSKFMQIPPDTSGMKDSEIKIRERLKNCTEFINEDWWPLVFKCYFASNPATKLNEKNIRQFLRREGVCIDLFDDSRISYSIGYGKAGNMKIQIDEIIQDLVKNANQAKILSEELTNMAEYFTRTFGEEHLKDEYTNEEFLMKTIGETASSDPMGLMAIVDNLKATSEDDNDIKGVNAYLEICAEVAKESLS